MRKRNCNNNHGTSALLRTGGACVGQHRNCYSVTTHVTIKRDEISHKQSTDAVLVQHSYFGTFNIGSQILNFKSCNSYNTVYVLCKSN